MLKSRLLKSAGVGLAMLTAASAQGQAAELGAADEPIRLVVLEWTGAVLSTHVAGQLLEKLGYRVEYITAGNFPQFSGLADGTLSASVEIWLNNVGEIFPRVLEEGRIENIGPLGLETREGWLYPSFMEGVCPGLPDWEALKEPACVQALTTPETAPDGRFLDYPSDWGSRAANIIADNALPYVAVPSGSEGALVAELQSAAAAETPLMMMFWGPHWVLAETEVGWVDMPPCLIEENEHCITPPDVAKVVWSGFGEKWPAAYEFLKAFQISADVQQQMMLRVDKNGERLEDVVREWIGENEATWQPFLDAAGG